MIPPISGAPLAQPAAGEPSSKLKEVAVRFEALLLSQLLKSMRESGSSSGWMGAGDDSSGASIMELAEQQMCQLLAARGGLGLAGLVAQGLGRKTGAD